MREGAGKDDQSAPADATSIDGWIARLRLIPYELRRFDVDLRRARLEYGFEPELVQELISRGLPHTLGEGSPRLAAVDLHYLGLRLGCATTYLAVLGSWASSLQAAGEGEWSAVEVRCAPHAPRGTDVTVLIGPGRYVRSRIGADRVAASVRVVPAGHWPAVGSALADLLADVASLDFCWLPESLEGDVEFTRQTRLSDCGNAVLYLFSQCTRLGVAARLAYGLLLATPLSTPHSWVEIAVGDRWVPVDPLLIGLLARHSTLDACAWPPTRSPGAALMRLADRQTPIVLSGERPLEASFLTSIV
jgi:Transglutaminase-like superfamily